MQTIILIALLVLVITEIIYIFFRRKYILFTNTVIDEIEDLINEDFKKEELNDENLKSKIKTQLYKLSYIVEQKVNLANESKENVQIMVSDITHQLKTPISNIVMYSDMNLNSDLTEEQKKNNLEIISTQVEKMEFLIDSLAKMSKLETKMITFQKDKHRIMDTIAEALTEVLPIAERKNIEINVECDENLSLIYDKKWTLEAIFNILENAMKYTNEGGKVSINVEKLEMFTKIDIIDNGIGISKENINNVFKRFFREQKVHNTEGMGIGLHLSKYIVEIQGGYIKLSTEINKGSTFSIFLPN